MDKLQELVIECLTHGVVIDEVILNEENSELQYSLLGFSKSGSGKLTIDNDGNVILKTRYGEVDKIETFEDIAHVAQRWQSYNPTYYTIPKCFDI